ncbi:MAG: CaiB/BaiF CoA transferase family protein [Planctomycetota bacterium]|jgi:crotonobetainyl-CoA:carnitine CoA-transferase CaiB-like acyl-CoA transferase
MPLKGIRVIDVSRYAPGPYCTMLMADLGADVVVVEAPPGVGRHVGEEMGVSERNKAFLPMGRNKRSVALDLKDEAMREAFLRLAEGADVVVEGFRPGVATRLGIHYQAVKARNPRIIYCSISGYGQSGPHASLPGHDLNYISLAGILGAIGWPGQPPSIPLNILADFAGGGLFAAFAVLAALVSRQQTGRGQYIDMAMSDGVMSLACLAASDYFSSGTPARPGEYFLNGAYPCYNVYATADDKWLSVACTEPWFWRNLCRVLGCEEYVEEQFNPDKFPEMFAFLRRKFREKTRDEWFATLKDQEISATPVYGLEEALADPHNRARGMISELEHPEYGKIAQIGVAPKFSATPGRVRTLAPKPGEHTEEVLWEVGFSKEEIARLTAWRHPGSG